MTYPPRPLHCRDLRKPPFIASSRQLFSSNHTMTTARSVATETALTPEVSPISSLILHPLLSDPKFVLAVLAVLLSVVVFSCPFSNTFRLS